MSIFIRSLILSLIAMCFITNSYAMALSMNKVNQAVVEQVISNHASV